MILLKFKKKFPTDEKRPTDKRFEVKIRGALFIRG